jgi:hypothetical protein
LGHCAIRSCMISMMKDCMRLELDRKEDYSTMRSVPTGLSLCISYQKLTTIHPSNRGRPIHGGRRFLRSTRCTRPNRQNDDSLHFFVGCVKGGARRSNQTVKNRHTNRRTSYEHCLGIYCSIALPHYTLPGVGSHVHNLLWRYPQSRMSMCGVDHDGAACFVGTIAWQSPSP